MLNTEMLLVSITAYAGMQCARVMLLKQNWICFFFLFFIIFLLLSLLS